MILSQATLAIIEQLAASSDDERVLAELVARLQDRPELVSAWTDAFLGYSPKRGEPRELGEARQKRWLERATAALAGGNRHAFYLWAGEQAAALALGGVPFDLVVRLIDAYYARTLGVMVRLMPGGPELELAVAALDHLVSGLFALAGAGYIQVLQDQVAMGARLQAVGRLGGGIAHSVNNLLAALLGHTQLLLQLARDQEMREELEQMQSAIVRGARALQPLHHFSRGHRSPVTLQTNVNEIVRDAAELTRFRWRDEAEAAGIVVDVVRDLADVPPARADPALLREIIVALLFNAIEAMPQGGLVTLRTERVKDEVWITVSDTGKGMGAEVQQRAVDPFFTTKGPEHAGMGLASAQEALSGSGGVLTLESRAGQGTTATIKLPVDEGPLPTPEVAVAPKGRTAQVLIVDDEPMIRELVARFLSRQGHSVAIADSGTEGMRLLDEHGPFDVVLTDLGMPGMSGWEIAAYVREHSPGTLTVMMTGWAADLDPERLRQAGIARVLFKPFDAERVLTLVNEAIQVRGGQGSGGK